ncbi:hypothetical protein [Acaryochloris thomasi]|uniref:hypothetical protein n=1 Tax=Acaryochloris thomasi TaxID=2929456 RepID=UPI00131421F2|nr:hypothetical protein [Acaryochloris thomasi]
MLFCRLLITPYEKSLWGDGSSHNIVKLLNFRQVRSQSIRIYTQVHCQCLGAIYQCSVGSKPVNHAFLLGSVA